MKRDGFLSAAEFASAKARVLGLELVEAKQAEAGGRRLTDGEFATVKARVLGVADGHLSVAEYAAAKARVLRLAAEASRGGNDSRGAMSPSI